MTDVAYAGTNNGRESIIRFYGEDFFVSPGFEVVESRVDLAWPTGAGVYLRIRGDEGPFTGKPWDIEFFAVLEMTDGVITQETDYYDPRPWENAP